MSQHRISQAKVPVDALFLAFHAPGRAEKDYYASDILSDILCNGPSSRLYRKLYKEQKLFTSIDAYITGNIDPGLLIIEGRPATGVSLETAEAAIWEELEQIKREGISDAELQKHKNKMESTLYFSEANVLNKAINLAFFELLGNAALINEEAKHYQALNTSDINKIAKQLLTKNNCSELHYKSST